LFEENTLKRKLRDGKPVIGIWNTLASPLLTEVMAHAGLDFQIIDLEHGPFILDQIHTHVSACERIPSCTPVVRVPVQDEWMILQAMDQGAHGVVVPHVSDRESAQRIALSTKYHPVGNRGFTPFSKAGGFNNKSTEVYVNTVNSEALTIVIVESKEGLDKLDEIVEVEGIDIIYFGAYDLSQALGHPGEVRHPDVIQAIKKGVDIVKSHGKFSGGFVPQSKDDVEWLLELGMKFITYEVDSSIMHTHIRNLKEWFDKVS